jgi:hypothetical protein
MRPIRHSGEIQMTPIPAPPVVSVLRRYEPHGRCSFSVNPAVRCAPARPPPGRHRIADCTGSPSFCRWAALRVFCTLHASFVPDKGPGCPVRPPGGEGSVRARNCSSIPTPARAAQSGIPGHLGQRATPGQSQRSATIRWRRPRGGAHRGAVARGSCVNRVYRSSAARLNVRTDSPHRCDGTWQPIIGG